jgi:hypothetical protein
VDISLFIGLVEISGMNIVVWQNEQLHIPSIHIFTPIKKSTLGRREEEGSKAGQHRPVKRTGVKVGDQAMLSQNSS